MDEKDFEDGHRPGPADWLTVPGRLLLILTVVGGACLFYFYFIGTYEDLPAGRYPVLLWLVPVGVAAVAFFFVTALVLERLGVRIYRNRASRR